MKDLIQTQKITLINLNDRDDVQIRIIYYFLGGLFEYVRDRRATPREVRDAHPESAPAKSNSNWATKILYAILNGLLTVVVFALFSVAVTAVLGAIYMFFTQTPQ